jgi:hypothetical protein
MNPDHLKGPGYSADVRMELYVNGDRLPIAQLGPDFLVVKEPIEHPPTDAEIALSIDGQENRWPVRLEQGLSAGQRRTPIGRAGQPNESAAD